MQGITPKLHKGFMEWECIGVYWFCSTVLDSLFTVPKGAKYIWVRWSDQSMPESVAVSVEYRVLHESDWWCTAEGQRATDLYERPNAILNRLFPKAKLGDKHTLYIQLLYED